LYFLDLICDKTVHLAYSSWLKGVSVKLSQDPFVFSYVNTIGGWFRGNGKKTQREIIRGRQTIVHQASRRKICLTVRSRCICPAFTITKMTGHQLEVNNKHTPSSLDEKSISFDA
jgi:hypothetical protein